MYNIDEDLHIRQPAVYGHEAMQKLIGANVLILDTKGLSTHIGIKQDLNN